MENEFKKPEFKSAWLWQQNFCFILGTFFDSKSLF
jgi:hypothetical protein